MKEKKITEVFWNIMFIETSEKYGKDILKSKESLEELDDIIALIEHYQIAMSKTKLPLNELIHRKENITQANVDFLSKLMVERNKDFTIRSLISDKDVKDFIKEHLEVECLFRNTFKYIKENEETDNPITYREFLMCFLDDCKCKPFNKETYLDEVKNNERLLEDKDISIGAYVIESLISILEVFDPIKYTKSEEEFVEVCELLASIYLKLLATLHATLGDLEKEDVKGKSPVINIVLPFIEPFPTKLMSKIFGLNPFICGKVQEKRMDAIFTALQDSLLRITDIKVNKGRVTPELSYYGNIGMFNFKIQAKIKEMFQYIIDNFPNTLKSNIHNIVPYKVRGVKQEKKEPKPKSTKTKRLKKK